MAADPLHQSHHVPQNYLTEEADDTFTTPAYPAEEPEILHARGKVAPQSNQGGLQEGGLGLAPEALNKHVGYGHLWAPT